MIVVIISECSGSARDRSVSIIDEFLPRIGRRTWSGKITEDGLDRMRKTLSASASRNTSVACHVVRRRRLDLKWIAGSKKRFGRTGIVPVSITGHDLVRAERLATSSIILLGLIIEGSALFHDVGKATLIFQQKLIKAGKIADPVRHELISALLLKELAERHPNDDGWLQELSDSTSAAKAIKDSWDALHKRAASDSFVKSLVKLNARNEYRPTARLQLPDKTKYPLMRTLATLVLTHHRLPGGSNEDGAIIPLTANLVHHDLIGTLKSLQGKKKTTPNLFDLPKEQKPLWEEMNWVNTVTEWARRLSASSIHEMDHDLLFRTMAIHGRTALQLGDHKASAQGKAASLAPDFRFDLSRIVANTNDKKEPAEYLADHMCSVRKRSRVAAVDVGVHESSMPHITGDDIPDSIASPSAPKGSRFRWQVDAAKATSSHMAKNDTQAGFFGILMAGTGSGKTRAIPAIMKAASGDLRYTLALGLRTLTLQSGDAYIKECKFNPSDVSVVIGSDIAQRLHELRNEVKEDTSDTNGTSAEDGPLEIVMSMDRNSRPVIPPAIEYFLSNQDAKNKIGAPILVTTIDSLMQAAHAKRGGHLEATLRLATSDLVIDEIDDYGNEDLVAISRLVFLAGAFGRRVMLSSATTGYLIAETFFDMYRKGYALHARLYGLDNKIDCGWYSDVDSSSKCVRLDCATSDPSYVDAFEKEHVSFVSVILNHLKTRDVYRKGQVIPVSNATTKGQFFSAVLSGMRTLHENTAFIDPKTGKHLSIGVVRWNNVSPSVEFVEWLSKQATGDILFKIIPYNGRLLPAVRFETEKCLDELLNRKIVHPDGTDPTLENGRVREILDTVEQHHVAIVVITTSMEEVGRDHDFDWALTEPMSARSLVQMSGRVQRHRMKICNLPNVGILERCLKDAIRNGSDLRPFSNPGVESGVDGDHDKSILSQFVLPNHEAAFAFDMARISERIDASEVICVDEPTSPIAKLERYRLKSYLSDGVGCPLSSIDFATKQNALITSYHADNRRFRRQHGKAYIFHIQFADDDIHWRRVNERTNENDNVDCDFEPISLNEAALFIQPVNLQPIVDEIVSRLADGEEIKEWQRVALLSVEMHVHDANTARYRYHPWIGMADRK